MTKTEYAEILKGDRWQTLRKEFLAEHLECERCYIPRWLASIAYDQDLHAHHLSYARVGTPQEIEDLEALCRRCHDVETHGRSDLRAPSDYSCTACRGRHYDPRSGLCQPCQVLFSVRDPLFFWMLLPSPDGEPLWKEVLGDIYFSIRRPDDRRYAVNEILDQLSKVDEKYNSQVFSISDNDIVPVVDIPEGVPHSS